MTIPSEAIPFAGTAGAAEQAPVIVLVGADKGGGAPESTIMVGDSKIDIETAQSATVPVIAVDFGYTDAPVTTYKPNRVISHFDDLWDAVADVRKAHGSRRRSAP